MKTTAFIARRTRALLMALVLVLAATVSLLAAQNAAPSPQSAAPSPPSAQEVIAFLKQAVSWYRHFAVEQQLASEASDVMFLSDNRQVAHQVVRLSFDFARAEAQLLSEGAANAQPAGEARYQSLFDMAAKADKQVQQSKSDIEALQQKLEAASGRKRQMLQSALAETESELRLAETRRDVLRGMLEFMSGANSGGGAGGLRAQIEEMERSVPAAKAQNGTATPGADGSVVAAQPKPEPAGILALINDLRVLNRKMHTLDDAIEQTDALAKSAKVMRAPFSGSLRQLVARGDAVANTPESNDPAALARQKSELDGLTSQFKQLSTVVLPLSKAGILLDLYKRNLTTWRNAVHEQYVAEWKSLGVRLALLGLALAAVGVIAEVWRRALFRYVHEPRRRHQFLVLRRIVLWFVSAMIVAFAFATELGSLATFAGLMTAGVAVALQNVILSVAGYFFLIGKYGVRVGDRVQISGVTGEVMDIGLVRLHLMEFAGGGTGAQPTGRVVVFSNSVVFQPSGGIFKQIPGTNFVWHEITLTLAPEGNYRAVEQRLLAAVEHVFAGQREGMERQRRHMERVLGPVAVHSLGPQSRLRLTHAGLEVVIRYPMDLEKSAEIDDRITRELLDAIEREPKLKLVGSGAPNIQPVTAAGAAVQ